MFQTPLRVEKVAEARSGGRARWSLLEPLIFDSKLIGRVEVPAGFTTDFSSVPRLPLAYLIAGDTAHASAVVHDLLCARATCSREWQLAADVFYEAMLAEGVPGWRRSVMVRAVRQADPWYEPPTSPPAVA